MKAPSGVIVQVAYIMDALRYREGALGAIWITLGLANLSMLASEASFGGSNPLFLSAAVSLCSGSTLFLVGKPSLYIGHSWTLAMLYLLVIMSYSFAHCRDVHLRVTG